jgi:hypothetical protein
MLSLDEKPTETLTVFRSRRQITVLNAWLHESIL